MNEILKEKDIEFIKFSNNFKDEFEKETGCVLPSCIENFLDSWYEFSDEQQMMFALGVCIREYHMKNFETPVHFALRFDRVLQVLNSEKNSNWIKIK